VELLILRLEGPLQSWGEQSKWDDRDTAYMPTKSGVVGLLACCLGYERGDARIKRLSDELSLSVRADRAGKIITDFHTVQGRPAIMNAEGKPRSGGNTFITHRSYLQDAAFLVVLSGKEMLLRLCADALEKPVWAPFLGRRSCVPSKPVFLELTSQYESPENALRLYPLAERADKKPLYQLECENGAAVRMDRLTDPANRLFGTRRVSVTSVLEEEVPS